MQFSLADVWAETHSYDGDLDTFPFCLVCKWGQKQGFFTENGEMVLTKGSKIQLSYLRNSTVIVSCKIIVIWKFLKY